MGRKKYKEKLSVDKFDLDDELIRQPQEFFDAAVDAVEANERTGLMKERHEIILARVEQDIRRNPKRHKVKKVSEAAIKAAKVKDKRGRQSFKDFLKAKRNEGVCQAAREAFGHRKKSLEKLVELRIAGYYTEPRIKDKKTRRRIDERTERGVREDLVGSLNKKTKRIKRRK